MNTEKIDKLFKQAQEDISEGKDEKEIVELWLEIKEAIRENTDLTTEQRRRLMLLIPEHLDKQIDKQILETVKEPQQPLSIYDLLQRPRSSDEAPRWHLY